MSEIMRASEKTRDRIGERTQIEREMRGHWTRAEHAHANAVERFERIASANPALAIEKAGADVIQLRALMLAWKEAVSQFHQSASPLYSHRFDRLAGYASDKAMLADNHLELKAGQNSFSERVEIERWRAIAVSWRAIRNFCRDQAQHCADRML